MPDNAPLLTSRIQHRVFSCRYRDKPSYIVKLPRQGSEEVAIYRRLQGDPASSSHTLPCEIVVVGSEEDGGFILILPCLQDAQSAPSYEWPLSKLLEFVYRVLQVCSRLRTVIR